MSALPDIHVRCLVVGGGPAGMMTGYLLARAGVDVLVLEKHADFNRDFRGDTIHPSTLELLHELGLLEEFLRLPHQDYARYAEYLMVMRFLSPISRACRRAANLSLSCRNGIFSTFSPAAQCTSPPLLCPCNMKSSICFLKMNRLSAFA